MRLFASLFFTCYMFGAATDPTLPQSTVDPSRPAVTGSTVVVASGDNFQTKYNAASCGDVLVVEAGATFTGAFELNKACTDGNWLQIVSSALASIPDVDYNTCQIAGTCTAPNTANFAKLRNTATGTVLQTSDSSFNEASYHYIAGLEITTTAFQYNLVVIGKNAEETSAAQFGQHITLDKMYIHGLPAEATAQVIHGALISGQYIAIVNSYISNIYSLFDAQAVGIYGGAGPFLLRNNFLEAAAENILAGGYGQTPGGNCTIDASPSPTTTSATVSSCTGTANGGGGGTYPTVGTWIMVADAGGWGSGQWTQITAATAGALTFSPAVATTPTTGASKLLWGTTPNDITVERNVMYKPLTWDPDDPSFDGVSRCMKNLGEIKMGRRWLINANWMENSFLQGCGGQNGVGFGFKSVDQNGDCPWCWASDITFTNNVLKNIGQTAFYLSPAESSNGNAPMQRLLIENNLFWPTDNLDVDNPSRVMQFASPFVDLLSPVDSIQIIHNNLLGPHNHIFVGGTLMNYTNLVIKDNIVQFDAYRWTGYCPAPGSTDGTSCMSVNVAPDSRDISNNAVVNSGALGVEQGINDATVLTRYGSYVLDDIVDTNIAMDYSGVNFTDFTGINSDYANWALLPESVWHNAASDGTDPGVNIAALTAALSPTVYGGVRISGNAIFSGAVIFK